MRIILLFSLTYCLTTTAGIFDCLPCFRQKPQGVAVDHYENVSFTHPTNLPEYDIDTIVGALHAREFTKVVKAVKDHSGNLNITSTGGELALVIATRIGYPALVRLFYESGANPIARDQAGVSAEKVAQDKDDATNQVQFVCHQDLKTAKAKLARAWKKIAPRLAGYEENAERTASPDETAPIVTTCSCACDFKINKSNKLLTLPCTHKIHTTCRLERIKSGMAQCPTCRAPFKLKAKEVAVRDAAQTLGAHKTQRETAIKGEMQAWLDMELTDRETALRLAGSAMLLPREEEVVEDGQYE